MTQRIKFTVLDKVWMPQGRILDKFTVFEEPKKSKTSPLFDFYSIIPQLQWVHAIYKTWLKIEKMKNVLNNKTLNKSWFGLKLVDQK